MTERTGMHRRVGALAAAVAAALGTAALAAGPATAAAASASNPLQPPVGAPAVESAPATLTGATPEVPQSVITAGAAKLKHPWKPESAKYGTGAINDIAVAGAGGTTIRVDEIYPTLANGTPAPGKFPVVLTMTPYGKGTGSSASPGSASSPAGSSPIGGADSYLVERGYIDVVEDVRGTGDSGGSFGLFDPIQTQDAIKVLDWAAHLKNSTGKVGTYGPSYLGIDQLLLAGAVGRHSPLKAIFPMVPANDIYRDTSFMGGLIDTEFDLAYLGLTTGLNQGNPIADTATDPQLLADLASVETDHAASFGSYDAALTAGILSGGDQAYDQDYWLARAPQTTIANVVRNGIPAYIVGGEFDLFQHGEPLNYAALQNAYEHRSVFAPMRAGQKTTGRYQLLDGPWEHINGSSVDVNPIELEWFDTWLKGENTGMGRTKTPMHYYDLGTGQFDETADYPFARTTPTRMYLGAGNTLSASAPTATSASDPLVFTQGGSICGRSIDQWSMGGISIAASEAQVIAPCVENDSLLDVAPTVQTYTSAPLTTPETLAGPVNATVYATATTTDTELVAELDEVTPDGTSYPITEGAIDGSLRAVNTSRSWTQNGMTLVPYHPYTQASAEPVTPGQLTEYQIEIFPTLITLAQGDSLRLTLSTSDTPHLSPTPANLATMLGGVYAIHYDSAGPSSLTMDLIPR